MNLGIYNFVKDSKISTLPLPLIHTTDAYSFREIITKGVMRPQPCEVYEGENLLYLFYGKPAYRNSMKNSTSQSCYFPVCFLFDYYALSKIKRVIPFDSGAFNAGMFHDYIHHKMNLTNFTLPPDSEVPLKIVKKFYDTNKSYFKGKPKNNLELPALDFEVQAYYSLITEGKKTDFDDRKSAIEMQFCEEIEISTRTIKAVVLPTCFLEDDNLLDMLCDLNAEIFDYATFHARPSEYTSEIYNRVNNYLESEGLL